MDQPLLVYTTFPDEHAAAGAARSLVQRKLVACANIIPGMQSIYAYDGEIEEGREAVMILKTRAARRDEVAAALKALHPYETPAIVFLPASADAATEAWIARETQAAE